MNKKWNKILKVNLLKSDKHKWGKLPIKRIEGSFLLEDDSELSYIKRFIKEEINTIKVQIKHYKNWTGKVYHPNTYKSLQFEKRTMEIILRMLCKSN